MGATILVPTEGWWSSVTCSARLVSLADEGGRTDNGVSKDNYQCINQWNNKIIAAKNIHLIEYLPDSGGTVFGAV
jgi:hypothetical protein